MKKLLCLLLSSLCLLTSCSNAPITSSNSSVSNHEDVSENSSPIENKFWADELIGGDIYQSSPIINYNGEIFYTTENAIKKFDKEKQKSILLVEMDGINALYSAENVIYFSRESEIYRYSPQDQTTTMILNKDNWEKNTYVSFHDFIVCQDVILINNALTLDIFDLNSQELYHFLPDVDEFALIDDTIFFVDHGEKSFSIYKKSLNSSPDEPPILVRGNGKSLRYEESVEDNTMFDGVIEMNNQLYYTKRVPAGVFKYNESGDDELIDAISDQTKEDFLFLVTSKDDTNLYYIGPENRLYKYDSITQQITLVCELPLPDNEFVISFQIIDGIVFYTVQSDNTIRYYQLNQ